MKTILIASPSRWMVQSASVARMSAEEGKEPDNCATAPPPYQFVSLCASNKSTDGVAITERRTAFT